MFLGYSLKMEGIHAKRHITYVIALQTRGYYAKSLLIGKAMGINDISAQPKLPIAAAGSGTLPNMAPRFKHTHFSRKPLGRRFHGPTP